MSDFIQHQQYREDQLRLKCNLQNYMIEPQKTMYDSVELIPGMILSNEPGYYKLNKYGIRIENLILVREKSDDLLFFENLSWCPIDKDLVKKDLLNKDEIKWFNKYHSNVYAKLNVYMNDKERQWLKIVTEPL